MIKTTFFAFILFVLMDANWRKRKRKEFAYLDICVLPGIG
jgi:hypothetical protein